MSISNLEDHYRKILGSPEPGNLVDLERKYKQCANEFRNVKEADGLHISAIQQNGEVNNAYLYLKALWSIDQRKRTKKDILKPFTLKASLEKFTLASIHRSLKSLIKAATIVVLITLGLQFIGFVIEAPNIMEKNRIQKINNSIKSEPIIKKTMAKHRLSSNLNLTSRSEISKRLIQPEIVKAARNCDYSNLHEIITTGEGVNISNYAGETALHWAARINCRKVTSMLLRHGANPSIRDHSGKTSFDWARDAGHLDLLAVLEKRKGH
ncbi:MAG TPA: ankyrin repeat domain-containing protein [Oligoflexia bacterium]|nr:ankyrin repeat domain-containing protein [Oligoflexia bacterium]HMP49095.1 ankyrin repeat domain-containing protein [Oligoflexia bacterium]